MTDQAKREKTSRDRIRCLLLLWTLEAGVIARTTLRERALAELSYRWETLTPAERTAFNNHLSRDLRALLDSGLLEAVHVSASGVIERFDEGSDQRMRSQVYYRPTLQPDFVVASPGGPVLDPRGPDIARWARGEQRGGEAGVRGRAELAFALAELRAAVGAGGVGRRLLDRVGQAVEARFGSATREPRIRYRPLPPALGEHGRSGVRPHVWEALVRALDQGLRIRIRLNRRKAVEAQRLCPHRIVWYNGRARLEVYWHHLGVRRWRAIPLHHLADLEALEMDRAEWAGAPPSADELEMLDSIWGADLEDPRFQALRDDDRRSLPELASEVELLFRGAAASAVRGDPGCRAATLTAEHDAAGLVVRYKVRTLVGAHFIKWLTSWGADVRVVRPVALAAELAAIARQVYEAHQEVLARADGPSGGAPHPR
ncbi:MAG: WYL domain-containing protein [Candidatus Sericytochromatia bacterium]|nr:WYL domain-containing protein [Candidatus Sericytochromatia bacterium]